MKFSDGLWLNQRGYDVSYAVQNSICCILCDFPVHRKVA